MKKVLILGGTGFLGRHLCELLVRSDWQITVPTQRMRNASAIQMLPTVTVLETDVHNEGSLRALTRDHDAVVNLVAVLQGSEASFARTHVELPDNLARACVAANKPRLIHISALGADARNPDALPSMYLRSKSRGEQVLRAEPLALTVLRPSVMFGEGDRFLNVFANLQKIAPVVPLAGAHAHFQPVWVQDVATAIVRCLENEHGTAGQTYEACGPDIFTLKQLVQLAAQYSGGHVRPVLSLPHGLARLQARLMELMPGEPLLSRDNLNSMKVDNIATGNFPGLDALGIQPAALAAIAPLYLGGQGLRSNLTAKRKTAGRF
jgi:uncharacterized protein YbjT (DUF2867 family)